MALLLLPVSQIPIVTATICTDSTSPLLMYAHSPYLLLEICLTVGAEMLSRTLVCLPERLVPPICLWMVNRLVPLLPTRAQLSLQVLLHSTIRKHHLSRNVLCPTLMTIIRCMDMSLRVVFSFPTLLLTVLSCLRLFVLFQASRIGCVTQERQTLALASVTPLF